MAGQQAFLMRAYRSIDGSFHTWRAGQFDPTMSEATGAQAPPHPTGEYSDFVVVGFLGGPLARSDADAFEVPGLGTSGVPITFTTAGVAEAPPGTECRDFESISVWVVVTNAPTTPSVVTVRSLWTNVDSVGSSADLGVQRSDDAILDGVSPQNKYLAEFEVTGTSASVGFALGPYNVPVRGRRHIVVVESSTNDVEGYVLAMRLA